MLKRARISFTIRPASAATHVRFWDGNRIRDVSSDGADVIAHATIVVAPHAVTDILVDADNAPIPHDSAGRVLRFQIRELHVAEAACHS